MAHVLTAGNAPALKSGSFVNVLRNYVSSLLANVREQRLLNELHSLDDRLLDDIGLSRLDLSDWHRTGVRPTH